MAANHTARNILCVKTLHKAMLKKGDKALWPDMYKRLKGVYDRGLMERTGETILGGFIWNDTEEGHTYWWTVYYRYSNTLRAITSKAVTTR